MMTDPTEGVIGPLEYTPTIHEVTPELRDQTLRTLGAISLYELQLDEQKREVSQRIHSVWFALRHPSEWAYTFREKEVLDSKYMHTNMMKTSAQQVLDGHMSASFFDALVSLSYIPLQDQNAQI